jgi:flagellar basal-body rod modification protein FlgD
MTESTTPLPLYPGASSRTAARAAVQSAPEEAAPKTKISSDFETFLRMLTVQMQNQDPLNPVDSTDYATQLATFSSVEQQVLTNDLLRALSEQIGGPGGSGGSLQAVSGWIGMEALTEAPVRFTGAPVALRATPVAGADRAELVVRDAAGAEVQRLAVDPAQRDLLWPGSDAAGQRLPAGRYSFAVTSYSAFTEIGTEAAAAYRPIREASATEDGVRLTLDDGTAVAPEAVLALRQPPG